MGGGDADGAICTPELVDFSGDARRPRDGVRRLVAVEPTATPGPTMAMAWSSCCSVALAPYEVLFAARRRGRLSLGAAVATHPAWVRLPDTGRGLRRTLARVVLPDLRHAESNGSIRTAGGGRSRTDERAPWRAWSGDRPGVWLADVQPGLPIGRGGMLGDAASSRYALADHRATGNDRCVCGERYPLLHVVGWVQCAGPLSRPGAAAAERYPSRCCRCWLR